MMKIHTALSFAVLLASLSVPAAAQSSFVSTMQKSNPAYAAQEKMTKPPKLRHQAKGRRGALAVTTTR